VFCAVLPSRPGNGFDRDAMNLIEAARFRAAESLDEHLSSAPRMSLMSRCDIDPANCGAVDREQMPTFDADAGVEHMFRRNWWCGGAPIT
jgi:hypothetical protein